MPDAVKTTIRMLSPNGAQTLEQEVMISVQCLGCRHRAAGLTCEAFPQGIPESILTGLVDHSKRYKGDRGIYFDAR